MDCQLGALGFEQERILELLRNTFNRQNGIHLRKWEGPAFLKLLSLTEVLDGFNCADRTYFCLGRSLGLLLVNYPDAVWTVGWRGLLSLRGLVCFLLGTGASRWSSREPVQGPWSAPWSSSQGHGAAPSLPSCPSTGTSAWVPRAQRCWSWGRVSEFAFSLESLFLADLACLPSASRQLVVCLLSRFSSCFQQSG